MGSSRRRNWKRWAHPVSPLQAARYERRMTGSEICARVRALCPGHGGKPCRLEQSKLSDYEQGKRNPGRAHTLCFMKVYGRSAEALGLLPRQGEELLATEPPEPQPATATPHCVPASGVSGWVLVPVELLTTLLWPHVGGRQAGEDRSGEQSLPE